MPNQIYLKGIVAGVAIFVLATALSSFVVPSKLFDSGEPDLRPEFVQKAYADLPRHNALLDAVASASWLLCLLPAKLLKQRFVLFFSIGALVESTIVMTYYNTAFLLYVRPLTTFFDIAFRTIFTSFFFVVPGLVSLGIIISQYVSAQPD